jgi:uncharacterized protein YdeI (YjbR/CyaY-like superfamily)
VGFHKAHSGTPSITWPEAVDEALCVGWIDGVRRSIDAARYTIRLTPRRATSTWSAVNVARVAVREAEGRMTPAGRAGGVLGARRAHPRAEARGPARRRLIRRWAGRWISRAAPARPA